MSTLSRIVTVAFRILIFALVTRVAIRSWTKELEPERPTTPDDESQHADEAPFSTRPRVLHMPDKNGVLAMISDVMGTTSDRPAQKDSSDRPAQKDTDWDRAYDKLLHLFKQQNDNVGALLKNYQNQHSLNDTPAPAETGKAAFVGVLERISENIEGGINYIFLPVIENILYTIQPVCWFCNFLWDAGVSIFRAVIWHPPSAVVHMLFFVSLAMLGTQWYFICKLHGYL